MGFQLRAGHPKSHLMLLHFCGALLAITEQLVHLHLVVVELLLEATQGRQDAVVEEVLHEVGALVNDLQLLVQ